MTTINVCQRKALAMRKLNREAVLNISCLVIALAGVALMGYLINV